MKAVVYGLGEIGKIVARAAVKRGIEIVGAVDINPEIVGKKVGEVVGADIDCKVKDKLEFEGDIAFLTTGSYLDSVYPQIKECIKSGFNVVSTCETLSYPEYRYPKLAKKIDSLAREYNVTVVGTGINPGFILDTLLVVLSSTCVEVERVLAVRSSDASKRRHTFKEKIGVGLKKEEVEEKLRKGEITGHVGYAESVMLVCEAMGLKPDKVFEGQEVVEENGIVKGLKGYGCATKGDKERVRVEFHAYVGAEEFELVEIFGDNSDKWKSTGTRGDLGTAALLINLAWTIAKHPPGLVKMVDLVPYKPAFQIS